MARQRQIWPHGHCDGMSWSNSCYNELVLKGGNDHHDRDGWYHQLPQAVLAIAVARPPPPPAGHGRNCCMGHGGESWAKSMHQKFLSHFRVSKQDVPFLFFEWSHLDAPFRER